MRIMSNINEEILVVGSIYDNFEKIESIEKLIHKYAAVIFNGNLLYPFDNISSVYTRISIMKALLQTGKVIYNLGAYDLKLSNILYQNNDHIDIQQWIISNPNVINIDFANSSSVLIISGGLTPNINNKKLLTDNIEVSFVSKINGKPWQVYYNGMLGYVISNNPLGNKPMFYSNAAQIGIQYKHKCDVYAQEINKFGLKNIIKL